MDSHTWVDFTTEFSSLNFVFIDSICDLVLKRPLKQTIGATCQDRKAPRHYASYKSFSLWLSTQAYDQRMDATMIKFGELNEALSGYIRNDAQDDNLMVTIDVSSKR